MEEREKQRMSVEEREKNRELERSPSVREYRNG